MSATVVYFFGFKHILLLFAMLQSLLLAFVLADRSQKNRTANKILSFIVLCFAVFLAEYIGLDSGVYQVQPHLIALSVPFFFVIGPLFFFYSNDLLGRKLLVTKLWHLIPAVLCILVMTPFYVRGSQYKLDAVSELVQDGYSTLPLFQFFLVSFVSFHLIIYFYRTYSFLRDYEAKVLEQSSSANVYTVTWLKKLAIGFNYLMLVFFLAWSDVFLMHSPNMRFLNVLAFSLCGFIFYLAILVYKKPELFVDYSPGRLPSPDFDEVKEKYQKSSLEQEQLDKYLEQLLEIIENDRPYLDGELRLSDLADKMDIPSHQLSQVINRATGKNFFDFINGYRIGFAKVLLDDSKEQDVNMLDIAMQSGFNSKASFNRVFKKETGLTPSQYRKNSLNKPNNSNQLIR